MKISLSLGLLLLLSACSKQNWYQGTQSALNAHCLKQPISEYEECMKAGSESYQEYENKRESLNKDAAASEQILP